VGFEKLSHLWESVRHCLWGGYVCIRERESERERESVRERKRGGEREKEGGREGERERKR